MPSKLRTRFVLYTVLWIWVTGAVVASIGWLQMTQGIGQQARARVEAAVRAGLSLIEDGAFLDGGELLTVAADSPGTEPWLRPLAARAARDGEVRGFAQVPDRGLSVVELTRAENDRLTGALYPLRGANRIPDALRALLLRGDSDPESAPTVTIFEGPRRIATNVRKADGVRAVGTLVSDVVARSVLERGEVFNDRAFVVDRWTITCYLPIRAADGAVLGMLYAGLDEEPYVSAERRRLWTFLLVILGITFVSSGLAWLVARRLTHPLSELTESSTAMAAGEYRKAELRGFAPEEIQCLAAAFNTMVDRVDSRTAQLAASRERAEKALADYLEVLTFIAHELKSPVAGSITTLDLIDQGLVGEVPEKMRPRLDALRRYLTRGLEIALTFHHLSRLESPGFALEQIRPTDVRTELVDLVLLDVEEDARKKRTSITVEGAGEAPLDLKLMRIVLVNLLGNAVKYGEDDGEVRVEITTAADRLRVGVWNRGVGIPDEQREHMFAKFFRLRDPKLKGRKGSGVGLYLARRIVELHGGTVGVDGEYGSWVRFWFELPRQTG